VSPTSPSKVAAPVSASASRVLVAISVAAWRNRELAPTLKAVTMRLDTDIKTVRRMTREMRTSRIEKPDSPTTAPDLPGAVMPGP
jgi:hypothetical protein